MKILLWKILKCTFKNLNLIIFRNIFEILTSTFLALPISLYGETLVSCRRISLKELFEEFCNFFNLWPLLAYTSNNLIPSSYIIVHIFWWWWKSPLGLILILKTPSACGCVATRLRVFYTLTFVRRRCTCWRSTN